MTINTIQYQTQKRVCCLNCYYTNKLLGVAKLKLVNCSIYIHACVALQHKNMPPKSVDACTFSNHILMDFHYL